MKWRLPTAMALVVVVVLAAGGALVGLAIHGPAGLSIGAAIGALAGVAAGYVPVLQDRAQQHQARQAEAQERVRAASEPQLEPAASGPSLLLRPERAVVGFTGRDTELTELRAWCESDHPRSVRVLAGAGGVGKTRLALKIAAECPRDALAPAMEAAAMFRELAAAMPDRYRRVLGRSLSSLGAVLAALDRRDEAAAARREAEEIR